LETMSIFSLTKPVKLDLHFTTLSNHNYDDLFSNLLNPEAVSFR